MIGKTIKNAAGNKLMQKNGEQQLEPCLDQEGNDFTRALNNQV